MIRRAPNDGKRKKTRYLTAANTAAARIDFSGHVVVACTIAQEAGTRAGAFGWCVSVYFAADGDFFQLQTYEIPYNQHQHTLTNLLIQICIYFCLFRERRNHWERASEIILFCDWSGGLIRSGCAHIICKLIPHHMLLRFWFCFGRVMAVPRGPSVCMM